MIDVLNSINAVVYDWDIISDRLVVGRQRAQGALGLSREPLWRRGGALPNSSPPIQRLTRFQAIKGSSAIDRGDGAPYRAIYNLLRYDGAKIAIEDIGRWFADASAGRSGPWRDAHHRRRRARSSDAMGPRSARDPLTGAFNRRHLIERLDAACAGHHAPALAIRRCRSRHREAARDQPALRL